MFGSPMALPDHDGFSKSISNMPRSAKAKESESPAMSSSSAKLELKKDLPGQK